MLFNSYAFVFIFLPAALTGFFCLSRFGKRFGAAWLIFSSFAFYGFWNPQFVCLLLGSIAFNYVIGERINAASADLARQRAWLILGIVGDLGLLFYYKYLAALIGLAAGLGIVSTRMPAALLPLGISFFTFTQIGYLVDVQQGVARNRGLLNYGLFVTFFPHLIAGPILHNREIMPQFEDTRTYSFSSANLTVGLVLFIVGLAKKCLLADPIAGAVAAGFGAPGQLTMLTAWFMMLTYALQLYFDFSGYADMAIGIARMFNVRFPLNFNSPYKATSIIDHWQRWHMTLTRFLTLYLFNPIALGIARRRTTRSKKIDRAAQATPEGFLSMVAIPIIVTMGVAGIWHGAGLQFLIFGLLHGVYLTINHAWRTMRPPRKLPAGRLTRLRHLILTMISVLVALVFFRAPSMAAAWTTLGAMAGMHGVGSVAIPAGLLRDLGQVGAMLAAHGYADAMPAMKFAESAVSVGWITVLCVIVWALPNSQEFMHRFTPALGRITPGNVRMLVWRPTSRWATALGVVAAVSVLAIGGTTEFVYFQF